MSVRSASSGDTSSDGGSSTVDKWIFDGLLDLDENQKWVGDLAERWETTSIATDAVLEGRALANGEAATAESVRRALLGHQRCLEHRRLLVGPDVGPIGAKQLFERGVDVQARGRGPERGLELVQVLAVQHERRGSGGGVGQLQLPGCRLSPMIQQ